MILCLSIGDGLVPYGDYLYNSVAKTKLLSSRSRSAAPSKVTNYFSISLDKFGVVDQPPRTHNYDFLLRLLGQIPCHTDHIYSGRQTLVTIV